MRILFVDDDERLSDVIARGLRESGHVVDTAVCGEDGLDLAREALYDAVILDVMMPGLDGFEVVRTMRAEGLATPVLMLTARDASDDTIAGLDAGADDYLKKPFVFGELEARLRSITRRTAPPAAPVLQLGDLRYDTHTRRAARGGRTIDLTTRESAFLEYFLRHAGRVVTRTAIETALWSIDNETESNVVDVYVRRLRTKLEAAGEARLLHTVRGSGYRLEAPDA
jgi:DNA-binding response OmpR family regulator